MTWFIRSSFGDDAGFLREQALALNVVF